MIDGVLAFCRFFVAGICGALFCYWAYWCLLGWASRTCDAPPWFAIRSRRMRSGRAGYLRMYFGWVLALTVYGLIATYDAPPFTWDWWYCAIFDGDWVPILAAPAPIAYACWRWGAGSNRTDNRGAAHAADATT